MATRLPEGHGNVNSKPNPVVSIKRNPDLDKTATALSTTKKGVEVTTASCCLCEEATLLASLTQGRRHYLRQIQRFKTYLPQSGDESVETCAKCLQEVKHLWDLTQQIEAIREDIATIVDRVVALKGRKGRGNCELISF